MTSVRGRWFALAAMLVVSMAASGCTGTGASPEREPVLGTIPIVSAPVNPVLPLDDFALNKQGYLTIQRAAWQAISRCTSRFGVTYTAPQPSGAGLPPLAGDNRLRFGLLDIDAARSRGYRYAGDLPDASGGRSGRSQWNPSPTELLIVRGATSGTKAPVDTGGKALPAGGCLAEATMVTDGTGATPSVDPDLVGKLSQETYERSFTDSRTAAAERRWSSCMQKAGFSFATSRDANNYRWPNPVGSQEKTAAQADVKCKLSTNLVGIWWAVETAYQKRSVDENAAALGQIRDFNQSQVKSATQVLRG